MTSGGPLKPLLPLPPKISSDLRELHKWPLAFRGEQLLHLLHTSYATGLLSRKTAISLKRGQIGPRLLVLITNTKLYMRYIEWYQNQ